MGIQQNMADTLRARKQLSGKSIEEWARELGIAQSTLQDYLKGIGNPTIKTVEYLAERLNVDPLALLSGNMEPEKYQTAQMLLNTVQLTSILPHQKRVRFAELFLELAELWEDEVCTPGSVPISNVLLNSSIPPQIISN